MVLIFVGGGSNKQSLIKDVGLSMFVFIIQKNLILMDA